MGELFGKKNKLIGITLKKILKAQTSKFDIKPNHELLSFLMNDLTTITDQEAVNYSLKLEPRGKDT